jgi:hypothetical protein
MTQGGSRGQPRSPTDLSAWPLTCANAVILDLARRHAVYGMQEVMARIGLALLTVVTEGVCSMTVAYWIVAALLALFYLYSGGLKVLRSPDQLRPMMGWIDTVPLRLVRTIGVLEVLGALGLILPPLTGIAPALAIAAAIGLVLLQVGGISLHLSRGEAKMIGLNVALLVLAGVEIWLATVWL